MDTDCISSLANTMVQDNPWVPYAPNYCVGHWDMAVHVQTPEHWYVGRRTFDESNQRSCGFHNDQRPNGRNTGPVLPQFCRLAPQCGRLAIGGRCTRWWDHVDLHFVVNFHEISRYKYGRNSTKHRQRCSCCLGCAVPYSERRQGLQASVSPLVTDLLES